MLTEAEARDLARLDVRIYRLERILKRARGERKRLRERRRRRSTAQVRVAHPNKGRLPLMTRAQRDLYRWLKHTKRMPRSEALIQLAIQCPCP